MTKPIQKFKNLMVHSGLTKFKGVRSGGWRQRLLTTATILAILLQLLLPFSHYSSIAPVAQAAIITVNTAATTIAGDGACSLREAIQAANTNAAVDTCVAGAVGLDIITFDAVLNGTPMVIAAGGTGENANATADFDVLEDLIISGSGILNTLIDGGDIERIFHIPPTAPAGTDLTLDALTVRNGRQAVGSNTNGRGGGVHNQSNGTLRITNSQITDNEVTQAGRDGGGVANSGGGRLEIVNSTIDTNRTLLGPDGSGAGVMNTTAGSITVITGTTISGNNAQGGLGGGVFSDQSLTIFNSTISGNSAVQGGGGVASDLAGNITLTSVTVTANSTTVAGTGGGIFTGNNAPGGIINLASTIVAGNTTATTNPDCNQLGGAINSTAGNPNLIGNNIGCAATFPVGNPNVNGDLVGDAAPLNPLLDPLNPNAPGTTATHALQPLSPAIDRGGLLCSGADTDQRGVLVVDVPGVNNGSPNCDIGAYEFDIVPGIQISGNTVAEGNNIVATIQLTGTVNAVVTVDFTTVDGSATAPSDYTATVQTVTFPAGTTLQTVNIPTAADAAVEGTETFQLQLINNNPGIPPSPVRARIIGAGTAIGTITDNNLPTVSIGNASAAEGTAATFNVALSAASTTPVTVTYSTGNISAIAGSDYTAATNQTVVIPAGPPGTAQITINTTNDTLFEGNETFSVTLSNPQGATLGTATGTGTINDNDTAPALSIANAPAVAEGNAGTTVNALFNVTLAPAAGTTVTVAYATSNGTATAGTDYQTKNGTLTFSPGVTQQQVTVQVTGDAVAELDETFNVTLSSPTPTGVTISKNIGVGTITNDDAGTPPGLPTLSISPVTIVEGNSGTQTVIFTVRLSAASTTEVRVDYATRDGTALAGSDYQAANGTLVFPPGTTEQTITVTINGDTTSEGDETFTVVLSNPTNATLAIAETTGTVTNDDTGGGTGGGKTVPGSSGNDDDGEDAAPAPPPPAAPAAPAAPSGSGAPATGGQSQSTLPVATLPETGVNGSSAAAWPWLILATVGLATLAIVWKAHQRQKNENQPDSDAPLADSPQAQPEIASKMAEEGSKQEE